MIEAASSLQGDEEHLRSGCGSGDVRRARMNWRVRGTMGALSQVTRGFFSPCARLPFLRCF